MHANNMKSNAAAALHLSYIIRAEDVVALCEAPDDETLAAETEPSVATTATELPGPRLGPEVSAPLTLDV